MKSVANGVANGKMPLAISGDEPELEPSCEIQIVPIDSIWPSPENNVLYRDRSTDDGDFGRLVESIRREGILSPILVSRDRCIVSGHQRRRGAHAAGFSTVPILVRDLRRSEHTRDEWVAVLREHNAGREKTFDELVREKLVDLDPDDAVAAVVADRTARGAVVGDKIDVVAVGPGRSQISAAKQPFAAAACTIVQSLSTYWPVSVRQVHYKLLNDPPLRNKRRRSSRYKNDKVSYQDLSDILTRLRLNGEVAWKAIRDETRPVSIPPRWDSAADFIAGDLDNFLWGYQRDLLQSQTNHIEVIAEKLTVQTIVERVSKKYGVPVVIGRGYSSIDTRHEIAKRFRMSSKDGLVLLCLSDCDPDGDTISQSLVQSMLDDFGIRAVGVRVALTREQCIKLNLPPMMTAKSGSKSQDAKRAKFVNKHGTDQVFELEAVPPETLEAWIDEAIRNGIDVEAFDHEAQVQRQEASEIAARRAAAMEILKNSDMSGFGGAV